MYKYEMHLHTVVGSACGISTGEDYIERAAELGYSGFVLTNHFYRGNSAVSRELSWKEFVDVYGEEYYRIRELAKKRDIDVLFGIEEGYGGGKECLIYGLLPEVISGCPEFKSMSINEISEFVRGKGGFIACAHPFRQRGYIKNATVPPIAELFDGCEVYNRGNPLEDNIPAEKFTRENNLLPICGGDVHSANGFGKSGIILPERARTEKDLVRLLKKGDYRLIACDKGENYGDLYEYELL